MTRIHWISLLLALPALGVSSRKGMPDVYTSTACLSAALRL